MTSISTDRMRYVLHGLRLLRIDEKDGIRAIALDGMINALVEGLNSELSRAP